VVKRQILGDIGIEKPQKIKPVRKKKKETKSEAVPLFRFPDEEFNAAVGNRIPAFSNPLDERGVLIPGTISVLDHRVTIAAPQVPRRSARVSSERDEMRREVALNIRVAMEVLENMNSTDTMTYVDNILRELRGEILRELTRHMR
jgi:hypothetical protein